MILFVCLSVHLCGGWDFYLVWGPGVKGLVLLFLSEVFLGVRLIFVRM